MAPIVRLSFALAALAALAPLATPQISLAPLSGRYYVRHVVMVSPAPGQLADSRSVSGTIQFDGAGRYSLTGFFTNRLAAPLGTSVTGTYTVSVTGLVTMTNPILTANTINARVAPSGLLTGSSTEAGGGVYDLLVAIPAPTTTISNASLNGAWWTGSVDYYQGDLAFARTAFFKLAPNNGAFPAFSVLGQANNLGRRPDDQNVTGATYSLNADGTGTATFPLPTGASPQQRLLTGTKTLYISRDGNVVLMGSNQAGGHDLIVGLRAPTAAVTNASFQGLFYTAGIRTDMGRFNAHAGATNSPGAGVVYQARRVRAADGVTNATGVHPYAFNADGSGRIELSSSAVSLDGSAFFTTGVSQADGNNYELVFGFKAPALPPSTVVNLSEYGAVNAATFAPYPNPIAPGSFLSLFGGGFSTETVQAPGLPFPTALGGVQVLVNNRAAPLYLVSPSQISLVVPQATETSGPASISVAAGAQRSNVIQVPVARTSPGLFTITQSGFGAGAILKTNFTLVSSSNPARRGETVLLFLNGLGAVSPAAPDGGAAGSSPLSQLVAPVNVYVGGVRALTSFQGLAPGLANLYQINLVIPANAPGGNRVPIGIETLDGFTDQADIAIEP